MLKNYKIKLSQPHIGGNELKYVQEAFLENEITPRGKFLDSFEKKICDFTKTKEAVALSSGTAAIHLALQVLGVKEGDKVLCSTFTFAASAFPITYLVGVPIFIDSEEETWNMCPELLERAIISEINKGKKPKVILVVHAYGMPAKMDEIMTISLKYDIPVLEDAAAALGSKYKGKLCGTMGEIGIFSFNGNKIITTGGGGALITNNKRYADKTLYLATQAKESVPYYEHKNIGYNYRMSNIAAAIGLGQLELIQKRVLERRNVFEFYKTKLMHIRDFSFLKEGKEVASNRWLTCFLIQSENKREKIQKRLMSKGLEFSCLWNPLHLQPVFLGCTSYLNGTSEKLFKKGLTLPSSSSLSIHDLDEIVKLILD